MFRSKLLPSLAAIFCLSGCVYAQALNMNLEAPTLGASGTGKTPSAPAREEARTVTVKIGRVATVQVASTPVYRTKSTGGGKYTTVKASTALAVVKEEGEWFGVLMANGAIGWVPSATVKFAGYDVVAKKTETARGTATSRGGEVARSTLTNDSIIRTALQYSGTPYVFGGTDPSAGMDCSAFVRMVFGQHGVNLPRTAREQAQVGATVPFDQLQPGDRLYFSCKYSYVDHCGIYAGNGYFVHCSASHHGVALDSLSSDFYWRSLVVAKRS